MGLKTNFVSLSTLALLSLANIVSAARLSSFCITDYGATPTTPVPTATTTATTTSTRTVTSTYKPTTTFTPIPTTITKTVTSTSKVTVTLTKTTGTYTSTSTLTATASTTSTTVITTTNTAVSTITNTDPVTVQPSSDFTALASELAPGGWSAGACAPTANKLKRGTRDIFAREPDAQPNPQPEVFARQTSSGGVVISGTGTGTVSPAQYPTSVGCTTLVYATATSTVVVTASTTVTKTLARVTASSTITTTTTVTSTKAPTKVSLLVVSTTSTSTSTATATSTSVASTTTTTTIYQPASTSYPQCDASNQVACVNGDMVSSINFVYNIFGIDGPTSARDCCIACSMNDGCGGSLYYPGGNACYGVIADGMCEGNNSYASFKVAPGPYYAGYVLSNSNCGRFQFLGIDNS